MADEVLRPIVLTHIVVPTEQWAGWAPGQEAARADAIAAGLASTAEGRARVRESVIQLRSKTNVEGGLVGLMIWVPDPVTGSVEAVGSLSTLSWRDSRRPTRDEYLADAQAYDGEPSIRVLDKDVGPIDRDMEAGPGVVEVMHISETHRGLFGRKRDGSVDLLVRGTVFPPSSSDALRFVWMTKPSNLDEMIPTAGACMKHTAVVLGEPLAP